MKKSEKIIDRFIVIYLLSIIYMKYYRNHVKIIEHSYCSMLFQTGNTVLSRNFSKIILMSHS